MTMGILYIEAYKCGAHLVVPLESLIVLFVLKYLKVLWVDVVLVEGRRASVTFRVPESALVGLKTTFVKIGDVPPKVLNCFFPIVVKKVDRFHIAGLCGVLRYVLKETSKVHSKSLCEKLLGFRGGCLMACAEVSVWTKFCEIDILQATKSNYSSVRSDELHEQIIPTELLRLENHFRQPVRIHNRGKREHELSRCRSKHNSLVSGDNREPDQRESGTASELCAEAEKDRDIADRLSYSLSLACDTVAEEQSFRVKSKKQKSPKKKVTPLLHHGYAEGVDQTLADVILFPCIHHLLAALNVKCPNELSSHIPSVLGWYYRVKGEPAISEAVRDLEFPSFPLLLPTEQILKNGTACESNLPLDDDLQSRLNPATLKEISSSLYIRDPKRSQVHSKNNIRQDEIERVMEQLKDHGVDVNYVPHPCADVHLDWTAMPQVVHPNFGELPTSRVLRKCQQVENLVSAVLQIVQPGDVIVDFCSGGGHLGLVLAYLLPHCQVIMIDNKEESLSRAFLRVETLGLHNATLYQTNLDYFRGSFTIGTSLHACGVATDLVLLHCLKAKAAVVSCPCCYGAVRNTHLISYPKSATFQKCGILCKDYCILGHAADQTHLNDPKTEQGQLCMGLIDTDRLQYLKENGYSTLLCTLEPSSCTPKNNLIIAWLSKASSHR